MNVAEQIEKMKKIQSKILDFVDKDFNEEEHFKSFIESKSY